MFCFKVIVFYSMSVRVIINMGIVFYSRKSEFVFIVLFSFYENCVREKFYFFFIDCGK